MPIGSRRSAIVFRMSSSSAFCTESTADPRRRCAAACAPRALARSASHARKGSPPSGDGANAGGISASVRFSSSRVSMRGSGGGTVWAAESAAAGAGEADAGAAAAAAGAGASRGASAPDAELFQQATTSNADSASTNRHMGGNGSFPEAGHTQELAAGGARGPRAPAAAATAARSSGPDPRSIQPCARAASAIIVAARVQVSFMAFFARKARRAAHAGAPRGERARAGRDAAAGILS